MHRQRVVDRLTWEMGFLNEFMSYFLVITEMDCFLWNANLIESLLRLAALSATLVLTFSLLFLAEEIQTSLCDAYGSGALGMESGTIPDSMISASSSYNEQSVGPQNARYMLASKFVSVPINIHFFGVD